MTETTREACAAIIRATVATAPGSGPINLAAQSMVVDLSRVYNLRIPKTAAESLSSSSLHSIAGNSINSAQPRKPVLESFGWSVVDKFDKGWPVDPDFFKRVEETFGHEAAAEWLTTESNTLNDRRPVDVLATPESRDEVLDLLHCIDHGFVY